MELSIIIPIYNTDTGHLKKCLESITNSTLTLSGVDYEVLLIDSGSTKDYVEYAKSYNARLIKTENRGIFAARMLGVEYARGKYCAFCDSDDTVSYDYHLPMLKSAVSEDADIVINGWANHTPHARYYPVGDETLCKNIDLSNERIIKKFFEYKGRYHSFYVLWNKLYKSSLLYKSIRVAYEHIGERRLSYAEDVLINFFLFKEAKRLINIHTGYYFYRIHPSQSVNATDEKRICSQADDMAFVLEIMEKHLHSTALFSHLCEWRILVASHHIDNARQRGLGYLIPQIKALYGIEGDIPKIKEIPCAVCLLPSNFQEIDESLFTIKSAGRPIRVGYSGSEHYTLSKLKQLSEEGAAIISKKDAEAVVPKEKYSFMERLLLDPFIYKISLHLFKKGSKMRAFLKKLISKP